MLLLIFLILGLFLYFVPSMIAYRKKNFNTILLVNLLLGWTVAGWIFVLVWAIMDRVPGYDSTTVIDLPDPPDDNIR